MESVDTLSLDIFSPWTLPPSTSETTPLLQVLTPLHYMRASDALDVPYLSSLIILEAADVAANQRNCSATRYKQLYA